MSLPLQSQLEDARLAGIYGLPTNAAGRVRMAAEAAGFACFEVDLSSVRSLPSALGALAHGLELPDWYGQNLDALYDCLTDFSWAAAAGYVVIVAHAEALNRVERGAVVALWEVFGAACDDWRLQDFPFWVFFDPGLEGLSTLEIPG